MVFANFFCEKIKKNAADNISAAFFLSNYATLLIQGEF